MKKKEGDQDGRTEKNGLEGALAPPKTHSAGSFPRGQPLRMAPTGGRFGNFNVRVVYCLRPHPFLPAECPRRLPQRFQVLGREAGHPLVGSAEVTPGP